MKRILLPLILLLASCTPPKAKLQEAYQCGYAEGLEKGRTEGYDEGYHQCKKVFSDIRLDQALASGVIDSAEYNELKEE